MKEIVSVNNMRRSDAYTIEKYESGRSLMYKAGVGVYESVEWKAPVAVVCGNGNNAGDGYVIAGLLHKAGIDVKIYLISDKFSEDGKYYFEKCLKYGVPYEKLESGGEGGNDWSFAKYSMVVDCLLGTGFKGQLREPVKSAVQAINSSGAYVVSVDINSGLNGDSGMAASVCNPTCEESTSSVTAERMENTENNADTIPGHNAGAVDASVLNNENKRLCVESDLTVSIGTYKSGLFLNMAKDVIGSKTNCDIGITPLERTYHLLEKEDFRDIFKERKNYSNKGTYGYLALVGGSAKYSGAIRLAYLANAAMRSGAGVVKVAAPKSLCGAITSHVLESTIFPISDNGEVIFVQKEIDELVRNVKAVAFGMGIGTGEGAKEALTYLLGNYKGKLIIDADGLTLLAGMDQSAIRDSGAKVILTPHIKEFSRLTGMTIDEILDSPIAFSEEYAKKNNAILLLKGPATIITDGTETYITDSGCPGMATAGSGDVLSGILSAVCAYTPDTLIAVAAGAYINGRAGELAQSKTNSISMIASDTVSCIADAVSEIMGTV